MTDARPPKVKRERLDVLVHEQGLAPTRQQAQRLIMAGQISVAGQPADKAGTKIPTDSIITLATPSAEQRYVSRGGLKLEHALDIFQLNPANVTAIDIGSSTGGFTDVLLQQGANHVYAVDVGTAQLAWKLREDSRVTVMERTNIRDLQSLPESVRCDCAVIDVSFISLKLVLPAATRFLRPGAWIIALVKPQFEAGKHEADRGGGVIRDLEVHRRVLRDLLDFIATTVPQLQPQGIANSPIAGREGNHEYLLWLTLTTHAEPVTLDIDEVVRTSVIAD